MKTDLDTFMEEAEDDFDQDFLRPTPWAMMLAARWMEALRDKIPPVRYSTAGDGGLRIEWFYSNASRGIIIAPDPTGRCYLKRIEGLDSSVYFVGETIALHIVVEYLTEMPAGATAG